MPHHTCTAALRPCSCAAITVVVQQVGAELDYVSIYNEVLRQQLQAAVTQTQQTAFDMVTRLHDIDRAVIQLNALTDTLIATHVTQGDSEIAAQIHQSRHVLVTMFMEAMASVQFQDILRQQLEHVMDALTGLDSHAASLARHLRGVQDESSTSEPLRPLAEQLQALYERYVMSTQRHSHHCVSAVVPPTATDSPPHTQVEPKIELF